MLQTSSSSSLPRMCKHTDLNITHEAFILSISLSRSLSLFLSLSPRVIVVGRALADPFRFVPRQYELSSPPEERVTKRQEKKYFNSRGSTKFSRVF